MAIRRAGLDPGGLVRGLARSVNSDIAAGKFTADRKMLPLFFRSEIPARAGSISDPIRAAALAAPGAGKIPLPAPPADLA